MRSKLLTALLFIAAAGMLPGTALAKDEFSVCWSIYVGWMPWDYGDAEGIVDKWADKYDIEIDVVQINDYIESINQYTSGRFDGCTMTNMDALTIPASGNVDSTALLVGDFSDGNDGIVMKNEDDLAEIEGKRVNLVELSVSHYLLARGLESVGLSERDIEVVNTADADIVSAFATPDVSSVVTWNPQLSSVLEQPNANLVFDSSQIPGEIMDLMVVNTETLEANPEFGKALTGAWYEIMAHMQGNDETAIEARTHMANAAGTDLEGYEAQLEATNMFHDPSEAVDFTRSDQLLETMQNVAEFSFRHGLLGQGAPSAEAVGIETPSGTYGNEGNVNLRFTDKYMQQAADGEL